MSEQPDQKSGGRFLSKVVKFIRSPTTDWADLDRPPSKSEPADEASAELKEMIERKRRNDFVRNRELEMLRKIRRRQASGERVDADEVLPSLNSDIESVAPDGRSGTLAKIHRLEAEMTDAWLDRPDRDQLADQGYEKTLPSDLLEVTGPGRESGAPPAFEETQPAPPELSGADGAGPAAVPQAAGGTAPPIIDLLDDIPVSPEVEEVAIRFANGDVAGAEASLVELLGEGGSHGSDLETWLMLFDLYRAAGEADKFDGAAATFAARFARSAPQWDLGMGAGSTVVPSASSAGGAPGEGVSAHWVAPSAIGTQSIAALNASLARQAPPWRIDWRRVKTIEAPAVPLMLEAFKRWAESPVRLKFLGVDQLLRVLATRTPTGQREVEESWWGLRLALLRVMSEADEFELVALNYCITYEMSPPSWEPPRCEFGLMTEAGQTVAPQESGTVPTESPSVWLTSDVTPLGMTTQSESDVAKLDLVGEIVEDVTEALRPLVPSIDTKQVEFNCRRLRRIDFAAAGSLLNWAIQQQGQGRQVVFQNVNRLVAVFFGVIGISDYARVRRRQD